MTQGIVLWFCVLVTVVVELLLLSISQVDGGELRLWRQVSVSFSRLNYTTSYLKTERHSLPEGGDATLYCSKTCTSHDWCDLWCSHPSTSPTHCIISNLIIMPTYRETNADTILTCYTRRPKDFATNARITAGKKFYTDNRREKENLIDGIYGHTSEQCFCSKSQPDQTWFTLDFGKIVAFSRVILVAHTLHHAEKHFTGIEVRVGKTEVTPPTEFANYDLFGVFPGAAEPRQVVVLQSPKPVSAQFVSVQKMVDNDASFQVCHIEVY